MEDRVSNDMNWEQVDKDTIEALNINLEAAYKQIRDLAEVISSQNQTIANMRQRFKDHGITITEKSISELTREELVALNKSIPAVRFNRADNPDKLKRSTYEDDLKTCQTIAKDREEECAGDLLNIITDYGRVDLEKYGIDPQTMNFKPGWGPNGKIERPSLFKRFLRFILP